MMLALWLVALVLLGLWTLLAWATQAVMQIDPRHLDDLKPLIERIPFSDWLDTWLPGWSALLGTLVELLQALLGWLGATAPFMVWTVWVVGAMLWLLCFGLLSLLLAALLRDSRADTRARRAPV